MKQYDQTNTIIYYFEEMPEKFRSVNTQVLKICLDDFNVIAMETILTQEFLSKYIATGYDCIRINQISQLMTLLSYFAPIAQKEQGKQKIWMSNSKSIYDYTREDRDEIMNTIAMIILSTIKFCSFESFDILVYPIEHYKTLATARKIKMMVANESILNNDNTYVSSMEIAHYIGENIEADTIEINKNFVVLAKKY